MIHNPIPKIEYVLLLDNTRMSSYSNDQLLEKIQVLEKDREELNKLTTKNKILDERLSSINTALQQIAKELNDRFYAS